MSDLTKRALLSGAGALAATAVAAQTSTPAVPTPPVAAANPRVILQTAAGAITVELAADRAPITTANFLRYVEAKRFDGATFYRALKLAASPLAGLVQAGAKNDAARAFPPIAHESTTVTGLSNRDGVISMARYAPGTATSEFFICVGDLRSLDADPTQPGDNEGFAAFGRVVDGLDVVRKILTSPVSPTAGDEGMKGQMLDPEIAIVAARRAG